MPPFRDRRRTKHPSLYGGFLGCPVCYGYGQIGGGTCPTCGGSGNGPDADGDYDGDTASPGAVSDTSGASGGSAADSGGAGSSAAS